MKAEDKASQLLRRYTLDFTMDFDLTRQAAILCVYEIIDVLTEGEQDPAYWQEVRDSLYARRTNKHEARADKFNEDL
jgi:hypothetical protein